ncbi:MAG: Rrf2 family transcriptional regulator [bacterium]|nr:Rrf2 family transcriptional regulator [bacterium]
MARLIRVSEGASMALHAMALLAAAPGSRRSTRGLAKELGVSGAHLSKVLQRLSREGLVAAVRGRSGGFSLARPAGEITLISIYEAIDGAVAGSRCLFARPVCGGGRCILGDVLKEADDRLRAYLARTRLAALAKAYRRKRRHAAANHTD